MSILTDLLNRVQAVSESLAQGDVIRDVLVRHEADVLDLQRQQLFEGKRPDGEDIRPLYSEDLKPRGYFHSVESAGRYAAWKEDISPYSASRNPDAPNLYINGRFHSELGVNFDAETVAVIGETSYAQGIMLKYADAFGLSPANWAAIFRERGAFEELLNEVKTMLYD